MTESIGVVVNCTNSLSRGYLAYLASIESWSVLADQIVIVDGGTNDDSYRVLKNWTKSDKWEVYSVPESLWASKGRWHAAQWTINTNIGLSRLETDWAFVICADYVLKTVALGEIRKVLVGNRDAQVLTYKRTKLDQYGGEYLTHLPGIILNLRKIREQGLEVGFGISERTRNPSDAPIYLERHTRFIDPVNGSIKKVYQGNSVSVDQGLDIVCTVYGHYFFNLAQMISKVIEYYQVYAVRYAKKAPKSKKIVIKEFGLSKENGILPKATELKKSHPPEVKRVIEEYYCSHMLGNTSGVAAQSILSRNLLRLNRAIRTRIFSLTSFPSVQESHIWKTVKEEPGAPLDLKALYKRQDVYIPKDMRINWDKENEFNESVSH